jgi:hypothetical protein
VKNEIVVYSETAEVGMMIVVTSSLHSLTQRGETSGLGSWVALV